MRCTTWEQVEAFYRRKLRKTGRLSMKVPFECEIGTPVTLGLELPNQIVIAIDGTVASAGTPVNGRTPIDVTLFGLSADLLARLKALVGDARVVAADEEGVDDERRLLLSREAELRRKRLLAAHEIVGVPRDPTAAELRAAWIALATRDHPDAVARYASPTLTSVAEETMILAARAYDRLRSAVVADNHGTSVGPTIRPPASWTAADDPMATGFFAEAVTPPVEDAVELVDASAVHRLPTTEQLAKLDSKKTIEMAPADVAELVAAAAAGDDPPPAADPLPPPPTPELPSLDELLPPPVVATVSAPAHASAGVRWSEPNDLFSDLDLGSQATGGESPIAFEDSLAQGRSGPGDRFVRQIRARLATGDAAGAKEMADAALHLYGGDRRLRGLVHIAAAMVACGRMDKTGAVAALETALQHDPSCVEAATALEQLRRAGVPSAPAIQRLFS
ncbi:MAG TPA: J domain-containing protein [Kofleriaceae bacterium]|nr:J domain-containing protein [Kofleriaceae bacterium]